MVSLMNGNNFEKVGITTHLMNPEINFFLPFYFFLRLLVCLCVQQCVKFLYTYTLSDITTVKHYFAKRNSSDQSFRCSRRPWEFHIAKMHLNPPYYELTAHKSSSESPPLLAEFRTEYDKL